MSQLVQQMVLLSAFAPLTTPAVALDGHFSQMQSCTPKGLPASSCWSTLEDEPQRPSRIDTQSLLQEFFTMHRSQSQSLVQESFRLHRTAEGTSSHSVQADNQTPSAAKSGNEQLVSGRGAAAADSPAQPSGPLQAEPQRPAATPGKAAEQEQVSPPVLQQTAAQPQLVPPPPPVDDGHILPHQSATPQEPPVVPLAPPPARHGRTIQIALQADPGRVPNTTGTGNGAVDGQVPPYEAPALKPLENGSGRPELLLWSGIACRVLILVLFVACVLRALASKVPLPCRGLQRYMDMRGCCRRQSSQASPSQPVASSVASDGNQGLGGPYLCPELVVPEGKECKLVVPRLLSASSLSNGKVSVCDTHGVAVLKACISYMSGNQSPSLEDLKRLSLTSVTGETAFASCRNIEASGGGTKTSRLTVYQRNEEPFGVLSADGFEADSGYSVISQRGSTTYFRAGFKEGVMNATDDCGRLLATIEPAGPSHSTVRIGQLVDAGLIAMALMGIDILQFSEAGSDKTSR